MIILREIRLQEISIKRIGVSPMKSTRLFRILRDLILLFVIRFRSIRSNAPALKTFLLGGFQDYLRRKSNIILFKIENLFNFLIILKVVSGDLKLRSWNFLNLFNLCFVQILLIIVRGLKITNSLLTLYLNICLKGMKFFVKLFSIRFKANISNFIILNKIYVNGAIFEEFFKKVKLFKVSDLEFRLLRLKDRKINFRSLS